MVYINGQKKIYIVIILYWLIWEFVSRIIVIYCDTSDRFRITLFGFGIIFGIFGTTLIMFIGAIVLGFVNKSNYKPPDPDNESDFSEAAKLRRRRNFHLPGAIVTTTLDVLILNILMFLFTLLIVAVFNISRFISEIVLVLAWFISMLGVFYTLLCRSLVSWDKIGELGWVYFKDNKLYLRKRDIKQYFIFPIFPLDPVFSSEPENKELWNIPVDEVEKIVWSTNYEWNYMLAYIIYSHSSITIGNKKFTRILILEQDRIRNEDEFKRYFKNKLEDRFIDEHTQPEILDSNKYSWDWDS